MFRTNYPAIAAINDNTADFLDLPALYENIFWIQVMATLTSLSVHMSLFIVVAIASWAGKIILMGYDEAISNFGL
jgi:hypothetical protein